MFFASRVKFVTVSAGETDFEEGNAVDTFRNLAAVNGAAGRPFTYLAQTDGGATLEIGLGIYTAGSPGSLSRLKVFHTWNGTVWSSTGDKLSFGVGTKTVSIVNLPEFSGAHQGEMHGANTTGTADGDNRVAAYAANFYPQIFAYRDFVQAVVRLHKKCAADATLAANGLAAKPILKHTAAGYAQVAADDYKQGQLLYLRYDATADGWQVLTGVLPEIVPDASATVKGRVELATIDETRLGADTARAVTPDGVAALWEKGANRPNSSTITIPVEGGSYFLCEGGSALTNIAIEGGSDRLKAGFIVRLHMNSARTMNNSSSLLLLQGVNRTLVAGAIVEFVYEGADVWRELGQIVPPPPPQNLVDVQHATATDDNNIGTSFEAAGLSKEIVVESGQLVEISGMFGWTVTGADTDPNTVVEWRIKRTTGGTPTDISPSFFIATTGKDTRSFNWIDEPGAGTHTYWIEMRKISGTFTFQMFPNNNDGKIILKKMIPAA